MIFEYPRYYSIVDVQMCVNMDVFILKGLFIKVLKKLYMDHFEQV